MIDLYDYTCNSCGHGDGMHSGTCPEELARDANYKISDWADRLRKWYDTVNPEYTVLHKIIKEMEEWY